MLAYTKTSCNASMCHQYSQGCYMPFNIILLFIVLFCSGCVALYPAQWEAITLKDELTGKETCRVRALSPIQTHSSFYPMVDMTDNKIRIGMHSPDENPIPVGDIKIRIDNQYGFLIKQEDMNYYLQPQIDISPQALVGYGRHLNHLIKSKLTELQLSFAAATAKALTSTSPYTVVSGEVAKKIFTQMLTGKFLDYRIMPTDKHGGTNGRYPLNADFLKALEVCDIDWYQ